MRTDKHVNGNEETRLNADELSTDDMATADQRPAGPEETPAQQRVDQDEAPVDNGDTPVELFAAADVERFRGEWQQVQTRFVDDPRDAVRGADHLVAEVMRSLASTFADHKHELEDQWQHGSEVETEDLRLALRRYRSFFNQLLDA